jgi:hypothetical protein
MGKVYLARSPGGRPAAVKVINDQLRHDEHALSRFRREVETLGTVRSAYTASLIDAELDTPPYWLATEYVPGPTLYAAVATNGPLPADLARVMLAALAEGLDAIHVRGVWHRDLKPHNVILSATGPQLIDFGIARTTGTSNLTQVGGALGSPGYIAPETITGGETGPGADVFALGATLAFAVTGRPPYGDGPFAAVSYRSVHGEVDLRGVDAGVAELIAACVQSDPARRPTPHQIVELCRAEADLVHHPAYQRALAVGSLTEQERAATVADLGGVSPGASEAVTALAPQMTATTDAAREAHAATLLAPDAGHHTPARPHEAGAFGPYQGTGPSPQSDGGGTGTRTGRRGLWVAIGAAVLVVAAVSALLVSHAFDDKGKDSASGHATPSASAGRAADVSADPSESGATASPSASPSASGTGAKPGRRRGGEAALHVRSREVRPDRALEADHAAGRQPGALRRVRNGTLGEPDRRRGQHGRVPGGRQLRGLQRPAPGAVGQQHADCQWIDPQGAGGRQHGHRDRHRGRLADQYRALRAWWSLPSHTG